MAAYFIRHVFLDASALVGWLLHPDVAQPGAAAIEAYCRAPERCCYSNEPCLTETLAVLKVKLRKGELTPAGYVLRTGILRSKIDRGSLKVSEFRYWDREISDKALALVEKYMEEGKKKRIDFLDALQILDVKEGPYKGFVDESETVLVTIDMALRDAARAEGVHVWCPISDPIPD